MKVQKTTPWLFVIVVLAILELVSVWAIKNNYLGRPNRYIPLRQNEFCSRMSRTFYGYGASYGSQFLSEAKGIVSEPIEEFTIEKAIAIREVLLNISSGKNEGIEGSPTELLRGLKAGKALTCRDLSLLYGFMLNLVGFNVRHIVVSRSLFDIWDSHSIVEVWDERRRKWILSDPTFNVSFKKNGEYLSSDEVYDLIHSGDYDSIKVLHGHPTKYEYSLKKYYISYFSLFNNLFYISHINPKSTVLKYSPLRWFDDRFAIKMLMTDKYPVRGNEIHIQNALIFLIFFLIPIVIVITLLMYCLNKVNSNDGFKKLFSNITMWQKKWT
jgi:hypothetical protein